MIPGFTLDQLADRLAGPQRKGQLQLVGAPAGDKAVDHRLLPPGQRLLLARTAATPATGQGRVASLLEGAHPLADKAAVDPDRGGHFDPPRATEHHVHRHTPQFGLRGGRKLSEVTVQRHAQSYQPISCGATYLTA